MGYPVYLILNCEFGYLPRILGVTCQQTSTRYIFFIFIVHQLYIKMIVLCCFKEMCLTERKSSAWKTLIRRVHELYGHISSLHVLGKMMFRLFLHCFLSCWLSGEHHCPSGYLLWMSHTLHYILWILFKWHFLFYSIVYKMKFFQS